MAVSHHDGARASRFHSFLLRIESHPLTASFGLIVRLHLASIWLQFGWGKIQSGWLTTSQLRPLIQLVADGRTNTWLDLYQPLSRWALELGIDRVLGVAFPLTELAIAAALMAGIAVRPAALMATFINLNLIFAGLSSWQYDGRIIAFQLLLLALGAAASRFGVRALASLRRRPPATPHRHSRPVLIADEARTHARPHVVIVGGGFAGLQAARALRDAPVDVTVVDRTNHHLFQPLLYQVATSVLSPSDVAVPIRVALRKQQNTTTMLAEVTKIDPETRQLELDGGRRVLGYDFLILAAGARHSYFGKDEWEAHAPGLKSLADAIEMRRRFLLAFERAEHTSDAPARAMEQTIVIVGGGPTGVELAGAIPEVARRTFARDFRHADTRRTRILLIEGGDRLLPALDPELSARAQSDLEALGVEVRTGARVTRVTGDAVYLDDECIPSRTVFWAAGIAASPLGRMLGAALDRAGRVLVGPDLSLPDHPEVFVVGDLAAASSRGVPVPAVATAANQMGRVAAQNVLATLDGRPRAPFVYDDKGSMAIISRHRAVAQIGRIRIQGSIASALWGLIHLIHLVGHRNRMRVLTGWAYSLITYERGDRLIPAAEAHTRWPVAAEGARAA